MSVLGHGVEICTTATRPASAPNGTLIFDTDTSQLLVRIGANWHLVESNNNSYVTATGGTQNTFTDYDGVTYKAHSFTSVGSSTFTVNNPGVCSVLIVGGGGGGSTRHAGGGGAGGVLYAQSVNLNAGNYTVTVGGGGAGTSTGGAAASAGGNSSFVGGGYSATALGGGGGNNTSGGGNGGGQGAGPHANFIRTNQSSSGPFLAFGNDGGVGGIGTTEAGYAGGGGGGAMQRGGDCTPAYATTNDSMGGQGGDGIALNITGTMRHYAGGGGGSAGGYGGAGGRGGKGGGGNGASGPGTGGNGAANTGGGAGAAGFIGGTNYLGGTGGSGIVIIRYRIS